MHTKSFTDQATTDQDASAHSLRARLRVLRQRVRVRATTVVEHTLQPLAEHAATMMGQTLQPLTERAARGLGLPSRRAMQEAKAELARLERVLDQLEQVVEQVRAAQPLAQQLADEARQQKQRPPVEAKAAHGSSSDETETHETATHEIETDGR